jgi:hypothetical protein
MHFAPGSMATVSVVHLIKSEMREDVRNFNQNTSFSAFQVDMNQECTWITVYDVQVSLFFLRWKIKLKCVSGFSSIRHIHTQMYIDIAMLLNIVNLFNSLGTDGDFCHQGRDTKLS